MKLLRDRPLLSGSDCTLSILDTLVASAAPMSNHVAANLAKWWKTKFLNGYKQFTVVPTDCSDGRPSDTEELLGGRHDAGAYSSSAGHEKDVSEEKSETNKKPPTTERRHLSFEEFECDVSVEGGVDTKGQERQEFSFTLYDFDGHGKITKDDIAGLVTTIYDTLGSTIKVPHYGSKTIRVKLTVSPDQRKKDEARKQQQQQNNKCNNNNNATSAESRPSKVKLQRDLNVTIRESRTPRRPHRRRKVPSKVDEKYGSCSSSCRSEDNCAADVSEEEEEDPLAERMYVSPNRRHRRCNNEARGCRGSKKRSSSLQREELLQIIQANMEKNNLSFQTSRKHCSNREGLSEHRHSHHRHRHKSTQYDDNVAARVHLRYLANLDLACYDPDCRYDNLLGAVVCASSKHHRSRSHDLPDPFPEYSSPYAYLRSKSHEERKCVLGHTSSPHHLKHRNREEDQARAMAQVVSWLEQEFSSSQKAKTDTKSTPASPKKPTNEKVDAPESPIEKHEHHHVHEHVHHHYHHYQETPVLV